MAQLTITSDTGETSTHDVQKDEVTIGRRKDNDICLPHLSVSGFHARLISERGCLMLEDLNSTNGTQINGDNVDRHVLIHSDRIVMGMYTLHYSENSVPVTLEPATAEKNVATEITDPNDDRAEPAFNHEPVFNDQQPLQGEAHEYQRIEPQLDPALVDDDMADIVAELAALRVEGGPKSGEIFVIKKPVTTLGRKGDQAGAIERKETGFYFVPLCLDAGDGAIRINGTGLSQDSEVKLATGDNLELAGTKVEFIYPFHR